MTTANPDPRDLINDTPMTSMQLIIVAITVLLNAMDGYDVLSISFASPGIAAEWGISSSALGVVLSMELVGMAIGSVALGPVADKLGRRSTLLGTLLVMTLGMFMVTTVTSIVELSIWRVITGLGIGGMLACNNAVVAEFANDKRRSLCISLMVIGYPLGGVVFGAVASWLLSIYEWRSVFYFGAAITGAMIPVVYFLVPESVHWVTRKQPNNSLERVNLSLRKLGKTVVDAMPLVNEEDRKKSVGDIFSAGLLGMTILVTLAYFFHVTTFYFILKWTPKIIADMGFAASAAGTVLTSANVGGALGGAVFGVLTARFGLKPLTICILFLTMLGVYAFGNTPEELATMALLACVAGFFGNAGISGLYSIVATAFPTHVRATATGVVIGIGRGGAVLSPILAGYLLDSGSTLPTVALIMGMGSLLGAVVLLFLKLGKDRPSEATTGHGVGQDPKSLEATASS